jgi:hypothetical protein
MRPTRLLVTLFAASIALLAAALVALDSFTWGGPGVGSSPPADPRGHLT